MIVLAIDPGPKQSAFVMWDSAVPRIMASDTVLNDTLRERLIMDDYPEAKIVAIEMVACYGMSVGADVFETCLWIGRFAERAEPTPVRLVYRKDVKMHLCHSMRAKDSNIRQALIDKYGPPGTKKAPGATFGVSGHLWSALAIADYVSTAPAA